MKIACPNCNSVIPAHRVNASADVAYCEPCNEAFALSALLAAEVPEDFKLYDPPPGAWVEETGSGWRIGASTRSPFALLLIPVMCVWSGGSLYAIYGSQIAVQEFSLRASLVGIPFVLVTLLMGSIVLMSFCGKVEVTCEGDDGWIFMGIGRFGWTRSFNWASITGIKEDSPSYRHAGDSGQVISLIGAGRLKFGSMVTDQRRYYLIHGLRCFLAQRRFDRGYEEDGEERFSRPRSPEWDAGIQEKLTRRSKDIQEI
jgi:hypothetical protein